MRILYGNVTLSCEQCGTPFDRRASYHRHLVEKRGITRTFCSRRCKEAAETRHDYGELRQKYEAGASIGRLAGEYGFCFETIRKRLRKMGVEIRPRSAHMTTDRNPTKGKGHSEEAKAKIREANIRQFSDPGARELAAHNQRRAMAEGRVPSVSKIEDLVAVELDRLGISYRRQAAIRDPPTGRYCACVDFLLAEGVVLEINGTYYHVDPRAYPDGPKHASQQRSLECYNRKMSALSRLGYRVIEIWEKEIRADVVEAVRVALA